MTFAAQISTTSTETAAPARWTLDGHRDFHALLALHAGGQASKGRHLRLTEDLLQRVRDWLGEIMRSRGTAPRCLKPIGSVMPDPLSPYPRLLPAYLGLVDALLERIEAGEDVVYAWVV